jgi:hypothetical protein
MYVISLRYFTRFIVQSNDFCAVLQGSEEIETTCITDTLTRFGADVTIASVMPGELVCKMSRGIKVNRFKSINRIFKCGIAHT